MSQHLSACYLLSAYLSVCVDFIDPLLSVHTNRFYGRLEFLIVKNRLPSAMPQSYKAAELLTYGFFF